MTGTRKRSAHYWIRRIFIVWAVIAMLWLSNSVRTQGVDDALLESSPGLIVVDGEKILEFTPVSAVSEGALIFICGAGVAAEAYAPLLRPLAEREGHRVYIVRLPWRFAPLDSHKKEALRRVRETMDSHPGVKLWILGGHSLGAALAARFAASNAVLISGLALVGTTHPRDQNLSAVEIPVMKIYATNDRVAPQEKVLANRALLPKHTKWVEIEGGNHSQFGHYGHQLLDGRATISREAQQELTRQSLLVALNTRAAQ